MGSAMKRLRTRNGTVDPIDAGILRALARDARVTMADLAREVGLSAPSVTERVRKLEETGIIEGYAAQVSPAALGLGLAAYRSEEHTSELQSLMRISYAVFCLKKKNNKEPI